MFIGVEDSSQVEILGILEALKVYAFLFQGTVILWKWFLQFSFLDLGRGWGWLEVPVLYKGNQAFIFFHDSKNLAQKV